jgi:hypothetical protein
LKKYRLEEEGKRINQGGWSTMLLESKSHYTYCFGSMGTTLETARKTGFFQWFHMAETDRRQEESGEVVRFRPSGDKFHDLCFLDVLLAPAGEFVRMELVVKRSFIDGADSLFAQDLVNSFLHAALPDACRNILEDFITEINTPAGDGQRPGFEVFKGRLNDWSTQTGWSRLHFANLSVVEVPSLVLNVGPNPEAPNAKPVESARPKPQSLLRKLQIVCRRRIQVSFQDIQRL